jgi:hypothetical protein
MNSLKQRVAQIFDETVRALKDKRRACADALRDAAAQLFPVPAAVPVPSRPRAGSSRPKR